jgi:nicotinamidase-related amidase
MSKPNENTALLVMDILDNFVARMGDKAEGVIAAISAAIAAAREASVPVIYVVVSFRKNFPEVSSENKSFNAMKASGTSMASLEEPIVIHAPVAPHPGEIVVTKRRISAFTGSDLEVVLRAANIRHLVLTGFSTSGVVLSTLREAADKDFRLTVLSDGCGDVDSEVHQVLLSKIFPRQADVITALELITILKTS